MHALPNTLGYQTITDEAARQKAKAESRSRAFGYDLPAKVSDGPAEVPVSE